VPSPSARGTISETAHRTTTSTAHACTAPPAAFPGAVGLCAVCLYDAQPAVPARALLLTARSELLSRLPYPGLRRHCGLRHTYHAIVLRHAARILRAALDPGFAGFASAQTRRCLCTCTRPSAPFLSPPGLFQPVPAATYPFFLAPILPIHQTATAKQQPLYVKTRMAAGRVAPV